MQSSSNHNRVWNWYKASQEDRYFAFSFFLIQSTIYHISGQCDDSREQMLLAFLHLKYTLLTGSKCQTRNNGGMMIRRRVQHIQTIAPLSWIVCICISHNSNMEFVSILVAGCFQLHKMHAVIQLSLSQPYSLCEGTNKRVRVTCRWGKKAMWAD